MQPGLRMPLGGRLWVALGLSTTAAYFLLPTGGVAQALVFAALGVSCGVAVLLGVVRYRPRRALPWCLFAVGQLVFALGDGLFNFYELALRIEAPFPSPADGLYLAGYPALVVGLLVLLRQRSPGEEATSLMDAGIVTMAVGTAAWVFLMAPYASDSTLTGPQQLISYAYPLMDAVLLGVAARLLLTSGWRSPSFRYLVLGLATLLVADITYAFLTLSETYYSGGPVDAGWLLSYVFFGAAALHPSMGRVFEVVSQRARRLTGQRVALLAGAALVAPASLVVQTARGEPVETAAIVTGSALIVPLVLGQMSALVRRVIAARHDPLTGLPNGDALAQPLRVAVAAARGGPPSALIVLDLHRFAGVNDALGRATGDRALAQVSDLLEAGARHDDLVVRLGGDEFAVLATGITAVEAAGLADQLRRSIADRRVCGGTTIVELGVSVGLAVIDGTVEGDEILARAASACDRARARGRNKVEIFEPGGVAETERATEGGWTARIADALRDGRLALVFQPIVEVRGGEVHHHEVLVRMLSDSGEMIPAATFIPPAERLGIVDEIDRWVIGAAVERIARERDAGRRLRCAVNLSGLSIAEDDTIAYVESEILRHGIEPSLLSFEITETVAMTNVARARLLMERLRDLGCSIALDDFGRGFSSFAYLRELPVDLMKIDAAFVRDLDRDPVNQAMVRALSEVAHSMGIRVVAEGVESAEVMETLPWLGVELAQGFHLGRPDLEPRVSERVDGLVAAGS